MWRDLEGAGSGGGGETLRRFRTTCRCEFSHLLGVCPNKTVRTHCKTARTRSKTARTRSKKVRTHSKTVKMHSKTVRVQQDSCGVLETVLYPRGTVVTTGSTVLLSSIAVE